MADSEIPDKFMPAVRVAVFWIALPFIFLFGAKDRYFDGTGYQVGACIAAALLSIVIAVYWDGIFRRHKLTVVLWGLAIIGLLLFGGAIGALAVRGNFFGAASDGAAVTETTSTTTSASSSPVPAGSASVQRASLRLLIRPNQDPEELTKENVWRWFVFTTVGVGANGERSPLATYIFLTFDRPVRTNYRRVFSPSNANLHFEVPDLTERSMVVGINNVDLTGQTVEIQVSGDPL
jgi:hypothetical protein